MAPRQAKQNVVQQQSSVLKAQGQEHQGFRNDCRSAEQKSSPAHSSLSKQSQQTPFIPKGQKRKRSHEPDDLLHTPAKQPQNFDVSSGIIDNILGPVDYWVIHRHWPKEYFKQDDKVRVNFKKYFEKDTWYEKYGMPEVNHLLARKKSASSLRGKQSEISSAIPSSTTTSDQKREVKSNLYTRPSYATVLATKGSFMDKSGLDITDISKSVCQALLEKDRDVLSPSLFHDDLFDKTCRKIQDRNEARVIQDITRLIVPSVETLATYGAIHLDHLIESVNEGWNSAIPFCGPRPQPDYSVGFGRSSFTEDQLEKLKPFIGEMTDTFTSYLWPRGRFTFHF